MLLKRFRATNYRNILHCDIAFETGVNILLGSNAQGKTNALEGIYYFARGKGFRTSSDSDLVRFGEDGFETSILFDSDGREQSLFYSFENGKRVRQRNGHAVKLTEMIGHFRAVLFYPEHLQIVKAGPEKRREFLNIAISQNDRTYVGYYGEYAKILENRNCLLKLAQKGGYVDLNELVAWSQKMAECAAHVYVARKRYIAGLSPIASLILSDISSSKEQMELRYIADVEADTFEEAYAAYEKLLTEDLSRECLAGCSLYGVHRDDMDILCGGISARSFASQGQQRSAVLALKLAEGEYSHTLSGEYPVFLFDDVLSELDESRRQYVLRQAQNKQMILTSCDLGENFHAFHRVLVEGGTYVSTHR